MKPDAGTPREGKVFQKFQEVRGEITAAAAELRRILTGRGLEHPPPSVAEI